MLTWTDLEKQFHGLEAQLRFARLDGHWGGTAGEHWRVAGALDSVASRRFEALAALAGQKLRAVVSQHSTAFEHVHSAPDGATAWYRSLARTSSAFRNDLVAYERDDNGNICGHIYGGSLERPAESSAVLCLQLQAEYADEPLASEAPREPEHSPTFLEKYAVPILIGVIATVVGGLLLAILS
jgi:hypothetical protein